MVLVLVLVFGLGLLLVLLFVVVFLGKGKGLRSGPTPLARQTPRLLKSGLKGVGKAVMKNPKLALAGLAIGAAAKGIQALRNRK